MRKQSNITFYDNFLKDFILIKTDIQRGESCGRKTLWQMEHIDVCPLEIVLFSYRPQTTMGIMRPR